jgi:uncharacterized protein with FMN-binding domain
MESNFLEGARKMKKKKIVLSVLAVVLVAVIAGVILISSYISRLNDRIASLTVSDVDLSQISDGTYDGQYSVFPVSAEVKVTVQDHAITQIELVKHENGKGAAAEVLPEKVVEAQSLNVDAIAGATHSSKVILKAIEDALMNAAHDN